MTNQILIIILALIIGFIVAFLTDGLFIKKTKNSRPYLTPLGIAIFGRNKGKYSEFVNDKKGTLIKMVDIVIGAIIGYLVYTFSVYLISMTFVFYFPLFIFSINSLYLIVRKKYGVIKLKEGLIISLLYLISIAWIILMIKY